MQDTLKEFVFIGQFQKAFNTRLLCQFSFPFHGEERWSIKNIFMQFNGNITPALQTPITLVCLFTVFSLFWLLDYEVRDIYKGLDRVSFMTHSYGSDVAFQEGQSSIVRLLIVRLLIRYPKCTSLTTNIEIYSP